MSKFIAYRITNLVNGKCYIGITNRTISIRWSQHCSALSGAIGSAIKKYGVQSFVIEEIAGAYDYDSLLAVEYDLVIQHNTLSPNGYNLVNGGLNSIPTEETRKRMSESAKKRIGRNVSEETREKISKSLMGHGFKPETLEKMRLNKLGKKASEETKKKLSIMRRGRKMHPHTPETIQKIKDAIKKKKENGWERPSPSKEKREKLRSIAKKRWSDPDWASFASKRISEGWAKRKLNIAGKL